MRAAIDIGTNTVLLLVAERKGDNTLEVIHEDQRIPRLGKGVDKDRMLQPASMERVLDALNDYRTLLKRDFAGVREVTVTATSAVRDASNRRAFLDRIARETDFEVKLLSGAEEAAYTFSGALSVLPGIEGEAVVLDIGGGSTEVAIGNTKGGSNESAIGDRHSFDMGSVRFTERFFTADPPPDSERMACNYTINELLKGKSLAMGSGEQPPLVGVAGTVTSLARMASGMHTCEPAMLNGKRMTLETIEEWVGNISNIASAELLSRYPGIMRGRSDVFLAGILILQGFMEYYGYPEMIISTGGIRHGAILRQPLK